MAHAEMPAEQLCLRTLAHAGRAKQHQTVSAPRKTHGCAVGVASKPASSIVWRVHRIALSHGPTCPWRRQKVRQCNFRTWNITAGTAERKLLAGGSDKLSQGLARELPHRRPAASRLATAHRPPRFSCVPIGRFHAPAARVRVPGETRRPVHFAPQGNLLDGRFPLLPRKTGPDFLTFPTPASNRQQEPPNSRRLGNRCERTRRAEISAPSPGGGLPRMPRFCHDAVRAVIILGHVLRARPVRSMPTARRCDRRRPRSPRPPRRTGRGITRNLSRQKV